MRDFLNTDNLFMIPINWSDHHKVPDVNVDIAQNFHNAYCTPKYVLLRNISIVGISKSMVLVIIFRVFMLLLSLMNSGPLRIIHLQCFKMVSKK